MKTLAIFTMTFLFVFASMQTQAQDLAVLTGPSKGSKNKIKIEKKKIKNLKKLSVSQLSVNSFMEDFGNLPDVKWRRSNYFDEAVYTLNGQKSTAYYDYNFELVGTTTEKTFADIPANAQKEIKARHKDYSVEQVIFFHDNADNETDMTLWKNQFESQDYYFVVLSKGADRIILSVDSDGNVSFFKKL